MSRSYQRGQLTHIFKPVPGRRNEAIDCLAYNVAAMSVLNIRNWDQLEIPVRGKAEKGEHGN